MTLQTLFFFLLACRATYLQFADVRDADEGHVTFNNDNTSETALNTTNRRLEENTPQTRRRTLALPPAEGQEETTRHAAALSGVRASEAVAAPAAPSQPQLQTRLAAAATVPSVALAAIPEHRGAGVETQVCKDIFISTHALSL